MPTRAIVFDFDGVIVDSEPAHARSIEIALNRLGLDFPYANDYSRFIGRGDKECFVEVAREQGRELSPDDLATLKSHKERVFVDCLAEGFIRPYDATLALIREAAAIHPPRRLLRLSPRQRRPGP
jgi:phosphoglycolate phosphatase-like HAD superfamily hydrolase